MSAWADVSSMTVAIAALALMAGGLIKGMIGIALPLVSVPLLATVMPLPQAVALLSLPLICTNIWQSTQGGHLSSVLRRFWPILLTLGITLPLTGQALVVLDTRALNLLVGVTVALSALPMLAAAMPPIPARAERWMAPLVGCVAGGLGGVSSFFGPPIAIYMLGLHLSKDLFVAAIALSYLTGTVALAGTLAANGVLTGTMMTMSVAALVPVAAGMAAGQALRRRIDQERFRKAVALALIAIGAGFAWRAVG